MTIIHRSKNHALTSIIVRMLQDNGATIKEGDKTSAHIFEWVGHVYSDYSDQLLSPSDESLADIATELAQVCDPVMGVKLKMPDGLALNMLNYLAYLGERNRYVVSTPINQPIDFIAIVRLIAANA